MAASSSSALDDHAVVGRGAMMAGTAAAFLATFVFRYLTVEFTDDHFVHLSRAWQIVQGGVPLRDFFDPGLIFQYYASAAALLWSGHNLLGEAILTAGLIAAGAGLTFVAATRLSGSFWIGLTAAFIGALSMPRLYNYPKVFFYALAIVGAWWYARRPGKGRLTALAVITVVAFLFRHDHGLYIGVAIVGLVVMRHWGERERTIAVSAQFALATAVLVAPFLVFVESTRGLWRYVGDLGGQAESLATVRSELLPISIDPAAPVLDVAPPSGPRINVRWADDLDDEARTTLERRHGLVRPEHVDGSTWSYVPVNIERPSIRTLINDPAVLDTHGIDRAAQQVEAEIPYYLGLQRQYPLLRVRLAPGVFSRGNARAWFYDVTMLTPVVALGVLGWLLWRNDIKAPEASVVAMASLLCLIIVQTIVRGSADSRLPDVANPICIAGAWLVGRCLKPRTGVGGLEKWARSVGVISFALITVWSIATDADAPASIRASRILAGPAGVWQRMSSVTALLRNRPLDNSDHDARGIPAVARYLFECTASADRVLVTWFAPQIVFFAERGFAGGQVYLRNGMHSSPGDQQLTIERLGRERVPVVLEQFDPDYRVYFSAVYDYVHQYYGRGSPTAESLTGVRVLVDKRLTPTRVYEPLELPCYR